MGFWRRIKVRISSLPIIPSTTTFRNHRSTSKMLLKTRNFWRCRWMTIARRNSTRIKIWWRSLITCSHNLLSMTLKSRTTLSQFALNRNTLTRYKTTGICYRKWVFLHTRQKTEQFKHKIIIRSKSLVDCRHLVFLEPIWGQGLGRRVDK